MPAAAVIPAPIAYTKVVAVKKLVVEFLRRRIGPLFTECVLGTSLHPRRNLGWHSVVGQESFVFYCEQNRVFKAGLGR